MTPLQQRIAEACASTPPRTKARRQALASVQWVLGCASGYAALAADPVGRCVIVDDIADAQVFDGRDNEEMKVRFFGAVLKTPFEPVLLPQALSPRNRSRK